MRGISKGKARFKGGPGSGHHGHPGLSGVWGGSRAFGAPKGGGGGGKPKKVKVTKPTDVGGVAHKKYSDAKELEKKLTKLINRLASDHGGIIKDLEHRLKTEASLARKILADMKEKGMTLEQAADAICDHIRYTLTFDHAEFVEKVRQVQKSMALEGWEKYDHKWKNFFRPGDDYDGYNCVFWNRKTGARFELQFHTHKSHVIKVQNHKLYETFRTLPEGSAERLKIYERMNNSWNTYPRPANWQELPGVTR